MSYISLYDATEHSENKMIVTFVAAYDSCGYQEVLLKILLKDEQKFVFISQSVWAAAAIAKTVTITTTRQACIVYRAC